MHLFANFTYSFMKGVIFMTYKQIEASREVRLWIKEIVLPVVVAGVTAVAMIPGLNEAVSNKIRDIKITKK